MSTMVTQQVAQCTLLHLEKGIPIERLNLQERQKRRLTKVMMVYEQFVRNPYIDPYQLFREMLKGKVSETNLPREAHRHEALFNFVINTMDKPTRKLSEYRVRAAGNRLMQMGIDQDNGRDIEAGAKIIIKVDHLDQPEHEDQDISKAMFLPPVIVTSAHDVDPTKEDMDDDETERIMNKYGAVQDDKQRMIAQKVSGMMARSGVMMEEDYEEEEGEE